jgi:hypothetical protein
MITIDRDDLSTMYVPPSRQGQIVVISYGHLTDGSGTGVRHTLDRSDGSEAWEVCDLGDCGCAFEGCDCYDPANTEPEGKFTWQPARLRS